MYLFSREYLTGFRKRKEERRKKAREDEMEKLKEEKRSQKEAVSGGLLKKIHSFPLTTITEKQRVNFLCMKIIDNSIRARLHQTSATTLQQLFDDARDIVINENNGVLGNWVAAPFWSDSIVFNGNGISGIIEELWQH